MFPIIWQSCCSSTSYMFINIYISNYIVDRKPVWSVWSIRTIFMRYLSKQVTQKSSFHKNISCCLTKRKCPAFQTHIFGKREPLRGGSTAKHMLSIFQIPRYSRLNSDLYSMMNIVDFQHRYLKTLKLLPRLSYICVALGTYIR